MSWLLLIPADRRQRPACVRASHLNQGAHALLGILLLEQRSQVSHSNQVIMATGDSFVIGDPPISWQNCPMIDNKLLLQSPDFPPSGRRGWWHMVWKTQSRFSGLLWPQKVHPGPQEKWLRAGPQRPAVSEPGAPCGYNQYSNSTLGAAPDVRLQTRALHFAAATAPVT